MYQVKKIGVKLALVWILFMSGVAYADSSRLSVGLGAGGVLDSNQVTILKVGYEMKPQTGIYSVRPLAQAIVTDTGAYHFSVGISRDFFLTNKWSWAISTSAGYYHEDTSGLTERLGNDVEFYSNISTSYQVNSSMSIKVELGHISNAGLGSKNPGAESLIVSATYQL